MVWCGGSSCIALGDDKIAITIVHVVGCLYDIGARSACLWLEEKKLSLQGTLACDAAMEQVGCGVGWCGVGWGGVGDAISVVWHRLRDRTHEDSGE